jgi:hypothetical protein
MDTRPPIFKEATKPLDAEEWINTMEDKSRMLRITEVLKIEYVAHQLQGPTVVEAPSHHFSPQCPHYLEGIH